MDARLFNRKRLRFSISEERPKAKESNRRVVHVSRESALEKWRRVVRSIIRNNIWTRECKDLVISESDTDPFHSPDRISFNPSDFKGHVYLCSLSEEVKQLFDKPTEQRTKEDIESLFRIVNKLSCFASYSPAARLKLTKFVRYCKFQANRIVVRQGHRALTSYFIIQGSVNVIVEEKDKNVVHRNFVGQMVGGNSFEDFALLQGSERRATVVCKEDTEFLRVDKDDFDQVVREEHTKQWDDRMNLFKSMPAFQNWSRKELYAANEASKIEEYPENAVIAKDKLHDTVYLVKDGECVIVREITLMKRTYPFGREKLILPSENGEKDMTLKRLKENERLLKYFLVIRQLKQGDYFGVGEQFKDTYVITKARRTELLLLPRSILDTYNRGKAAEAMRRFILDTQLSRREIFNDFIKTLRWRKYKRELVENVLLQKPWRGHASYRDVPKCTKYENTSTSSHASPALCSKIRNAQRRPLIM